MDKMLRLLLIDDNPDDRMLVIRGLRRELPNLEVESITEGKGFARALEAGDFDLVITDYELHWTNGLAILRAVKGRWPDCPVIMFTGTGSEEIAVEAMKAGLDDYVIKSHKHFVRLPAAVRSVLAQAQQRQAAKEAEARYRNLFNSVPMGLYRISPQGEILDANPTLMDMLGYLDRESLMGVIAADLYMDTEEYQQWLALMERKGVVRNFEVQLRRRDGTVIWVEKNTQTVWDAEGRLLYYEGSLEDITERKQAEEQLKNSHQQLRDLSAHLQSVREEERTRIAREIHDELGQALTGLKIDLAWLQNRLYQTRAIVPRELLLEKIRSMSTLVDTTIQSVRKISTQLRPGVLDDLGLTAAIEWQAHEFQRRSGIRCKVALQPEDIVLNQTQSTGIFRIFQEILTNIVRHANATRVNIGMREDGGTLLLQVSDNGRGITESDISGSQSLGILGMRERAVLLGGSVTIGGIQGKGTTVTVRIPLRKS